MTVERVGERDLGDLLPLMRGYCDFYGAAPGDDELLTLSRALIADPEREGVQLIARDEDGIAIGFADWSAGAAYVVTLAPDGRGIAARTGPLTRGARYGFCRDGKRICVTPPG